MHFTLNDPTFPQYNMMEIASKVAMRAHGSANTVNRAKQGGTIKKDPDGMPTLQFAVGAKIVGIMFPERFNGQWCTGYHDGDRGSFPANYINLQTPPKEDVLMHAQSSLLAVAKWDFKPPKGDKDSGWLKISKGDKIENIGYTFVDQWCWSGKNQKSKWGIFPSAYVEHLRDSRPASKGGHSRYSSMTPSVPSTPVLVRGSTGLSNPGSMAARVGLPFGNPLGRHKSNRSNVSLETVRHSNRPNLDGLGIRS